MLFIQVDRTRCNQISLKNIMLNNKKKTSKFCIVKNLFFLFIFIHKNIFDFIDLKKNIHIKIIFRLV